MSKPIKVIDLFAGPGGLGEGFSSLYIDDKPRFKIAISIEKEASAHRTLKLRALFRHFPKGQVPDAYYSFLRGELGQHPEDQLYKLPQMQDALKAAEKEAQQITLGDDTDTAFKRISEAVGKDDCILIGGPPCQAYSLVGRARNYGAKDKQYSATEDHRNFLYKEYLKVIAKYQPLVFVMENVKGMLSAKIDGELIFTSIRQDLQNPSKAVGVRAEKQRGNHKYKIFSFVVGDGKEDLYGEPLLEPQDFIIKSEKYGVPQARHRVILLGVREDIADSVTQELLLKEFPNTPTVQQVISDLPEIRSKLSRGGDSLDRWRSAVQGVTSASLSSIKSDPHIENSVFKSFKNNISGNRNSPEDTGADKGLKRTGYNGEMPKHLKRWYRDPKLNCYVTNHESRGHIEGDLHRYLYYSTYASIMGESPKSYNLPGALWPDHKNFDSGKFADRFRVQLAERPGTTVTSHISKDGHYFIHYDPAQCRSLTVREAARIQTFPDNYYFVGNRTQQYVQVGNAVPPYLAKQLAKIVSSVI